jgi:hypothetical protein
VLISEKITISIHLAFSKRSTKHVINENYI